jgi:hypothetical protein
MSDPIEVYRYDPKLPHGEAGLGEFMRVAMEVERWQAIRGGLAEWLAWVGIPLWMMASRPGLLPHGVDRLVIALWGMVGTFFLYAVWTGWKWRRRKARYRLEPPSAEE